MPNQLPFKFPNTSPHEGFPIGNGNFGALVWGEKNRFHVTINLQNYWNHCGKIVWGKNASYEKACKVIIETPANELRSYEPDFIGFEKEGMPRPTRMPMGSFDLIQNSDVKDGILDMGRGLALLNGSIPLSISMSKDLIFVESANFAVEAVPNNSPEVIEYRKKYGIPAPELFHIDNICGWVQENPGEPVMCAACAKREDGILITAVLGSNRAKAMEKARTKISEADSCRIARRRTERFYEDWWRRTPRVKLSEPRHQTLYEYGMFRLSGFTQPGTPAPTLQGPWIEDDRMPPWQSDYHFNINVQMAHWPMLSGNHPEQFSPLAKMLKTWMPQMREYAKRFVGIEDGIMLPHGCDDRCCPADTNWKCQFDPGSAGWTALMFWDLYRYFLDKDTLLEIGYPMLRGALRVYEAMIEKTGNFSFYAPSPEYVPDGGRAWGKNPSFHLAIIHSLANACLKSVKLLGIKEKRASAWKTLLKSMPKASLHGDEILIWDGLPLRESHRHHSHLAGIYPFDIFDIDGKDRKMLEHSLWRWSGLGTGGWTGWCTTWAAIIWARLGNAKAAYYMLDQYERFFTGQNYFGSHNAFAKGFTTFLNERPPYIMQMDGVCGAVATIMEMLVHERGGEVKKIPAVPKEWGDIEFEGIRLPGNMTASCLAGSGKNRKIKIG